MVYNYTVAPEELQAWRERTGFTQARLAQALNVRVMTVSRWETGTRKIPPFLELALNWLEHEGGAKDRAKRAPEKKMKRREH
jgi:transcriptional regulator with XRE-family HTH domain